MRKKFYFSIIAFICIYVLIGCSSAKPMQTPNTQEGERVALLSLIANPDKYDEVRATVRGVLRAEEDGIALYMFAEDAEYESHISALWLGKYEEIKTFTKEQLQAMDGKYVGVTGTIAATKYGPTGDYNCEMTNIENVAEVDAVNPLPSESPGE